MTGPQDRGKSGEKGCRETGFLPQGSRKRGRESTMKKDRHTRIIEIISGQDIETQEELADALRRSGYEVTQATVSRDIRDLRLTKVQRGRGHQ